MSSMWRSDCCQMFKHQLLSSLYQGQVKSSGRNAFIHFHTSRATFGFSFLMRYTSVPEPGACELPTGLKQVYRKWLWHHPSVIAKPCPLTMPPSDGCDGGLKVIRKASGVITSPGYPLPYPPNLNCLYGIDVSGNLTMESLLAGCIPVTIWGFFDRIWQWDINLLEWPWTWQWSGVQS